MGRVLLRVDLDLTALEEELVEVIYEKISGGEYDKEGLRNAIHDILTKEMVEDDKCGKILFCHQVLSDDVASGCCGD